VVGGILNNFDPSNAKYYDYAGSYRYYAYEQRGRVLGETNGSNGGRKQREARDADLWR
jgi:hypothetical protein